MRIEGARVAITGASSGIGAAAAVAFARRGCKLSVAARNASALEEVAQRARAAGSPEVRARVVDVTLPQDVGAWAEDLREAWGGLDIAVANAGVGHYGPFLTAQPEHMDQLLRTNVLGVWHTVQALAPLLEQSRGRVVVVGSVAGKVPVPYLSTYCATKAALVNWTRAVRPELRARGIGLTLFAPGSTKTPFARRALRVGAVKRPDMNEGIGKGASADSVAEAMVRALRWSRREVELSANGRVGVAAAALAPHLLARALERGMRPRRKPEVPRAESQP